MNMNYFKADTCMYNKFDVVYFILHSEPGKSLETVAINVSDAKCIAVTFIVLVPHKIWGWEKNKTILRICFEHKDLGNWKGTTTEFRTTRYAV